METIQLSGRIAKSVYHEGLETVGIVYHRPHPVSCLQAIGIQLCLMLALDGVCRGALCLHHRQRFAVASEEHIVGISHPMCIGHALQLHLHACSRCLHQSLRVQYLPSSLLQHQVYVQSSGLCLGDVYGQCLHGLGRFQHLLVGRLHHLFGSLHHLHRLGHEHRGLQRAGNQGLVEGSNALHHTQFYQHCRHHVVDVQQTEERLLLAHRAYVSTHISHLADIVHRHHHPVIANERGERLTIHQFHQRGTLTHLYVLHPVERVYHILQCLARTYGTDVGIAHLVFLCSRAESVQVGEFKIL